MSYQRPIEVLLFVVCWTNISPSPLLAQIIPDNTLGNENSVITPEATIEGGAIRDNNLFHSFSEFNVGNGDAVYFASPDGIANILTRVTGNNLSEIFGTLGVNGNANLFLLNPNGIVFGENAALDVNGSFLATTAESYLFSNGFEYSAANPDIPPLLTINIPVGLQMGNNPGNITVRGTGHNLGLDNFTFAPIRDFRPVGLEVSSGKTLALIGGEINFTGGNLTAAAGTVELGSVGEGERVSLNSIDGGFIFDYGEINDFGDINLTQATSIEVSGSGGGDINLQGKNISISENSAIIANTQGDDNGGTLGITASDSVKIIGTDEGLFPSAIFTQIETGATGDGNALKINTSNLEIANNAFISHSNAGAGKARDVSFNADTIEITGSSFPTFYATGIFSQTLFGGAGNSGNLTFDVENLRLINGGSISTTTLDRGNGGNLTINAKLIELIGTAPNGFPSVLSTGVAFLEATGKGGNLTLNSDRLLVKDGGQIASGTFGIGDGGDLTINMGEIEITGVSPQGSPSGLFSGVNSPEATGKAGNLTLNGDRLVLKDGGEIISGTFGIGDGGDLTINVGEIEITGVSSQGLPSGLYSGVNSPEATGKGGNLTINGDRLLVKDGGQIISGTLGIGDGGDLKINTPELSILDGGLITSETRGSGNAGNLDVVGKTITVSGSDAIGNSSQISSSVGFPSAMGNSGEIKIETETLRLIDGGQIAVSTLGIGNGGNLSIDASKSIEIKGINNNTTPEGANQIFFSGLFASVQNTGTGDGGNLTIKTPRLQVLDGGIISASTFGQGDAGNLTIKASDLEVNGVIVNHLDTVSGIVANVETNAIGKGGNLNIESENLSLLNGGQISASSFGDGDGGNVVVSADTIRATGESPDGLLSGIYALAKENSTGNGGSIRVTVGDILLEERAKIAADTFGDGDGGNLDLIAESLEMKQGTIVSSDTFGAGNAGNVSLKVTNLNILEGAHIGTVSFGDDGGNGGNLTISGSEIAIEGIDSETGFASSILASVEGSSTASAGTIAIDTNTLNLRDEAKISVSNLSNGNSGNLNITTSKLNLDRSAIIEAQVNQGNRGNINLNSDNIFLSNNSEITVKATGTATGGNITINNQENIVLLDNSRITANAIVGNGGNIDIYTQGLFVDLNSDLNASSELGLDGNIELETITSDRFIELNPLPENPLDATQQISAGCSLKNNFAIAGRGGLPDNPGQYLRSQTLWNDLRLPDLQTVNIGMQKLDFAEYSQQSKILEAQNWRINKQGNIELIVARNLPLEHNLVLSNYNCKRSRVR